jgi:hypothetical protein
LPVPVWPNEIVIQDALLTTSREHEEALAEIVMRPSPPVAAKFAVAGEIRNEH